MSLDDVADAIEEEWYSAAPPHDIAQTERTDDRVRVLVELIKSELERSERRKR